jgi:ribokinase
MILVLGSANADLVVRVERLPAPGETVTGGRFYEAAGGKGANQAVAAARAGGRVAFLGCVGTDAFGERAAASLAADGVDLRFLKRDPERATGVGLIAVDARGENAIAVAPGANLSILEADVDGALDALRDVDVVLVSLEVPLPSARRAIARGRAAGSRTILVPAPVPPDPELPDSTLRDVSVLVPNEVEARALGGSPERLLARGAGAVVMTRGARGALVATREGNCEVPAFPVTPVDTVGAGDCFAGALAVALAEGRDLASASRFACAAAAISVTRAGAQPSLPRRAEIDALLARGA